jgi:predicted DCC family thiol-disulfide oxidoreductase YuxK
MQITTEASEGVKENVETVDCLTCCEPIVYFSVSECGHTSICSMCVIRMRVLFDELECPLCKVQQNIVIFTANPNAQYADLIRKKDKMMWDGKCKGTSRSLRSSFAVSHATAYFEDLAYESEVRKLWELKCSVCSTNFPSLNQLTNHIKGAHNLQYWHAILLPFAFLFANF